MKTTFLSILLVLTLNSFGQDKKVDEWLVFYLGGQSNMAGVAQAKDLPKELISGYEDIYIFQGRTEPNGADSAGIGIWEELRPGHGVYFTTNGTENIHSDYFGPELSLGKRLKELYPDKKIALVKYARGGSKLDTLGKIDDYGCWAPGISNYKHQPTQTDFFISTVNNAFSVRDINNDGIKDRLIPSGIFWMQGEADALSKGRALNYRENLQTMIRIMRSVLRDMHLPVVIGKISDSSNKQGGYRKIWKYGETVMYAQEQVAEEDDRVNIVNRTMFYNYGDPAHYDVDGYIDLGIQFGNEMYLLIRNRKSRRGLPKVEFITPPDITNKKTN